MRNLYKISCLLTLLSLALSACRDEGFFIDDEVERQDNLPVEFDFSIADRHETRGMDFAKTAFEPEDVVHVQGIFHMSDDTELRKYGAFRFDGEKWSFAANTNSGEDLEGGTGNTGNADTASGFSWPNNAITADFTAYYIKSSNSLLVPVSDPDTEITTTLLSDVVGTSASNPDTDPLQASIEGVKYGHTIVLHFEHACAFLTVEELQGGVSSVFWFTRRQGVTTATDFNNAFRLYLNTNKELKFEFVQVPDEDFEDEIYIQGRTLNYSEEGRQKSSAGFFLPPGRYLNFIVGYPGSTSMVDYMSYSKTYIPDQENPGDEPGGNQPGGDDSGDPGDNPGGDDSGNTGGDIVGGDGSDDPQKPAVNPYNELKANGVYTFNISKSVGVIINNSDDSTMWHEDDDPIYDVKAEEFLWDVAHNLELWADDGTQLLEPNGSLSKLLRHVNLQWEEYDIFPPSEINGGTWWEPILGQGVTFDGNGYYVYNLGSPLFRANDGLIRNLGIANADINVVSRATYSPWENYQPADPDDSGYVPPVNTPSKALEFNRHGAICGFLENGRIENIRVKTAQPSWDTENKYREVFNINVELKGTGLTDENHSIGCLVGSSANGTINQIEIRTSMSLTVSNYNEEYYDGEGMSANIGGIIGQNLQEVHSIGIGNSQVRINVTNNCFDNDASFMVGGIVGLHGGGQVTDVVLQNITIDSRKSSGYGAMIGGAAGSLSNVTDGGKLLECQVSGIVYAGKSQGDMDGNGYVYTGGLVGDCYESYEVNGCRTNMSVIGPYNNPDQNIENYVDDGTVDYATGGMFGSIHNIPGQTPYNILNNIATGDQLRGPGTYIGTFAGTVPNGETWAGNYEGKDIICSFKQTNAQKEIGNEK